MLTQKSDGELLRLYYESRSEQAFAELMRRYARLVYTACLRETCDAALAEDAAQGVFLLLSQKAASMQRRQSLAGWLFLASRMTSKNMRRSEMRRQAHELQALEMRPEPRDNALWEQIEPALNEALNRLKPKEQEAILLRFPGERSLAEVGAALGVSENTARMRVNRALEKARGHLAKAGVTVSAALLATLWLERNSQALPVALTGGTGGMDAAGAPSATDGAALAARRAGRHMALRNAAQWSLGAALVLLIFGGANQFQKERTRRDAQARHNFFAAVGTWKGKLEFADDRSGQRFTYPAAVQLEAQAGGDMIQATATYGGSSSSDVTTFEFDPQSRNCRVNNGGTHASHRLTAAGEFAAIGPDDFRFEGRDASRAVDVRLRLTRTTDSLIILEEYRRPGESSFRFRNRFQLTR